MKIKTLLMATMAAIVLCGCSLIQKLESPAAQPFDTVAIAVGVDAIVGTNPLVEVARASAIKQIAVQVLAADTGTLATVDALLVVVNAKVAALNLAPGDQAAAALFLAVVESAINQYTAKLTSTATASNVQAAVSFVAQAVIAECTRLGAP